MCAATISCLCVTEDRPAFAEWVLWNFEKQDFAERELVVVDSSRGASALPESDSVRVLRAPPGTSVPAKRNLALAAARGELLTWFDDDDWQHPRKLSLLAAALAGKPLAGARQSWFVDLKSGRSAAFRLGAGLLFNSVGFTRTLADGVAFDERRARASDTPWVRALRHKARGREAVLADPLFFWLCHDRNLSNPAGRRRLDLPLASVKSAVGAGAWGDTDAQLDALRARLEQPAARAARKRAAQPRRKRLCVAVTTYDRPDALARLLDDVEREGSDLDLDVRVYDDGSPDGYDAIERRLRARGWTYVRAARRHGKEDWWTWWNTILADLRSTDAPTLVVLQDDLRLCDGFFARSLDLWSGIRDARKGSLFLHLDETGATMRRARWTTARPHRVGSVVNCGWVDCTAFVCERATLDALRWRLDPISPRRWQGNRLLGSGVGAQLSVRLHRARLSMYRVDESLAVHVEGPSRMNPEARLRLPMRTVRYVGGDAAAQALARPREAVTATLASIPSRERGLAAVVEALLPQVDSLGVYLNGHARVPAFLDDPRIVVGHAQENLGDAGKFFRADDVHGYHLLCDDDIRYPADYVAAMVAGIERHERQAVVGFHGSLVRNGTGDYHRSRTLHHFAQALAADTPVHVLGTGLAGYHTSTIAVSPADVPSPNMADIWFALLGQQQCVPFVCLRRDARWLAELPGLARDSIYRRVLAGGSDFGATRAVRAHGTWQVHAPARATRRALPRPAARRAGPPVRVAVSGPTRRAVLLLPDRDHITLAVQRARTYYEADLLAAIRERQRGGKFVDVGAHYGNHTVYFVLECAADLVVAIEPNPPAHAGLLANVEANGIGDRVTALPLAVHPTLSRVDVVPLPWRPRGRHGALTNSGTVGVKAPPQRGTGSTAAATLDEILAPFDAISVVKVDAEGLGAEILASGRGTLESHRPLVAVETATDAQFEKVRALLAPLGYEPVGRYCWTPTWLWASATAR